MGENDEDIMEAVKLGKVSMAGSEWSMISAEAKEIVNKMLVLDPKKRFSAKEVMEHPWFKNNREFNENQDEN